MEAANIDQRWSKLNHRKDETAQLTALENPHNLLKRVQSENIEI